MENNEIGVSLNQKCKELIDQFMEKEYSEAHTNFREYVKAHIISLVEACIYADQHNSAGIIVSIEYINLDKAKFLAEQAFIAGISAHITRSTGVEPVVFNQWWKKFLTKEAKNISDWCPLPDVEEKKEEKGSYKDNFPKISPDDFAKARDSIGLRFNR